MTAPPPALPPPRVNHNIVFVRVPEGRGAPEPIVIPPPRQQHIVYVLSKTRPQAQRVIELPPQQQPQPEVFFVNYADGENPQLPIGIDLQSALGAAVTSDTLVINPDPVGAPGLPTGAALGEGIVVSPSAEFTTPFDAGLDALQPQGQSIPGQDLFQTPAVQTQGFQPLASVFDSLDPFQATQGFSSVPSQTIDAPGVQYTAPSRRI